MTRMYYSVTITTTSISFPASHTHALSISSPCSLRYACAMLITYYSIASAVGCRRGNVFVVVEYSSLKKSNERNQSVFICFLL